MELNPYLESLRRDLAAAAAPAGEEAARVAELLGSSLEASARLALLEALSDAAAEITTHLNNTSVEVRMRGRDADIVVTESYPAPPVPPMPPVPPAPPAPPGMPEAPDSGDISRITLRLPEHLKQAVERAAGSEGISVNAWLVRAIALSVQTPGQPPFPPSAHVRYGRRVTGFAQA
ncbi:toxin-antitoxin system HicB family antitoxin [Longispora albida]|uniref:toxin-antitoxin system HicB family antitoxin n=1 Tax=Longispora albida TaxID=203523 RepID=UPI000382B36D|nr:toxin-antitoxin system HicB family antitoxin [Longispora albida]